MSRAPVLIVDADDAYAELATEFFRGSFVLAHNVDDARQAVMSANTPGLIILDVHLNGESGFELLKWVKESQFRLIPVAVYTADRNIDVRRKALKLGANAFLDKWTPPIRSDVFAKFASAYGLYCDSLAVPRRVVFMSHARKDKAIVRATGKFLEQEGIDTWIDEAELEFGGSLIQQLRNALDEVDLLIAFISRHSVTSQWVQKELEIAMTQEIGDRRVRVIPVLLDDSKLPGFLLGKFYADFSTAYKRKKNRPQLAKSIHNLSLADLI